MGNDQMDTVMNKEERYFFSGIAVMVICGWMYMFGSFCAASFDIHTWEGPGRFFIALLATVGSLVAVSTINKWE